MRKIKQLISIFLISLILLLNTSTLTLAKESLQAPAAPDATTIETAPSPPQAPTAPEAPKPPSPPETPKKDPIPIKNTPESPSVKPVSAPVDNDLAKKDPVASPSPSYSPTTPLTNTTKTDPSSSSENVKNATGSKNTVNSTTNSSENNHQTNNAQVSNTPSSTVLTGGNISSQNTGSNNNLASGDANASATIINALNTNIAGVDVVEFNISDNHTGDIILDFSSPCTSSCALKNVLNNQGNGLKSNNTLTSVNSSSDQTFESNDASVNNQISLSADSGNNLSSQNTGGDSNITTGQANVDANILTFANNNISGKVILGVVNIFGNLQGNIVLTKEALKAISGSQNFIQNLGNGSNSTNSAVLADNSSNQTFQSNDASIQNNLVFDTQTGGNITKGNTGGNSKVETGQANTSVSTLNIANSNIVSDDTWWLVIINKAGKWVGQIMGAPAGSQIAGSEGTEFQVDDQGQVTASINSGNGSASNNSTSTTSNLEKIDSQTNQADLVNNVHLSANTGKNTASDNTGGNSLIKTGDANIVANIVNFVNNNIIGSGKLVVTLVNVLGSWAGDFITPGQTASSTSKNPNHTNTPSPSSTPETSLQIVQHLTVPTPINSNDNLIFKPVSQGPTITRQLLLSSRFPRPEAKSSPLPRPIPQVAGATKTALKPATTQLPAHTLTLADNLNKNKTIKINLAWLVIIIPGGLAGYLAIKRLTAKQKNLNRT